MMRQSMKCVNEGIVEENPRYGWNRDRVFCFGFGFVFVWWFGFVFFSSLTQDPSLFSASTLCF
jgi:hypothetical protein